MKLLLHTCCAPCSVKCIDTLRGEGIEPDLYWFNPNIHPFTEYRSRRDTLVSYAQSIGARLLLEDEYGLRSFVQAVCPDFDNRCTYCYSVRMSAAARYAAEHGYDGFSTTLLISPYQNHEGIQAAARQAAAEYGVEFVYRDFRPYFREGQQIARDLGLYMQKYCGCVFSEEDRYKKKKK